MLTKIINNKEEFLNKEIEIIGFVSKKRNLGNKIFIDLRNIKGAIQLVIESDKSKVIDLAKSIGNEFVIKVKGCLKKRKSINKNIILGDLEIIVNDIEIISKAITTPLIIGETTDALEEIRYKYRYLDLRRPNIANILKLRSKVNKIIHNFFDDNDFIEIETPILTKATPEGARDYLIPSRLYPNKHYALPQSPQIYKQLLMVAGLERYYQIARCFRDEDLRKDRQPEFTQLDIEISNIKEEDIYNLIEKLIYKIFKNIKNIDVKTPFEKITYYDALNYYGSDKPDTRYDLKLKDVTEIMKNIDFNDFKNVQTIKMLCLENHNYTNKDIKKFQEIAKTYKINNLFYIKYSDGNFNSGISKFLNENIKNKLTNIIINNNNKDFIILFSAGKWLDSCVSLGEIRKYVAKKHNMYKENQYSFNWIIDWPLFEYDIENKKYAPMHHPFTAFQSSSIEDFKNKKYDKVLARAYDIVVNGYELGGGSIRITDPSIQKKVMNIIGLDDNTIKEKFSTIIEAYEYGSPIHGGIALGLDRLMMVLANTQNITDVIAFPKTLTAKELMLDTPS